MIRKLNKRYKMTADKLLAGQINQQLVDAWYKPWSFQLCLHDDLYIGISNSWACKAGIKLHNKINEELMKP